MKKGGRYFIQVVFEHGKIVEQLFVGGFGLGPLKKGPDDVVYIIDYRFLKFDLILFPSFQ